MKKVAIKTYLLLIQSIIAINATSRQHIADTNNNKSKKTYKYYKRRSYQWNANLHQPTGIATSFEQSIFHKHQSQPNCNVEDDDGSSNILHRTPLSTTTKKEQMKNIIQDIFSNYPTFLTKPSLTFGLCRSVPSNVEEKEDCNHNLQTSLLHLNVLTFGKPRIVKPSKHIFINDNRPSSTEEEVICCIEIPIEGGLLANVESSASTTTKSKKKKKKKKKEDHGCIRFTWLQTKQPKYQQRDIKYTNHPKIILITEIRGSYRPTLAGSKLPISNMRKVLYYSTQRMLHTYVMWKYHDYVVRECSRRIVDE